MSRTGGVRFRWKDYRQPYGRKTIRLPVEEFMRRFLMHVVQRDFRRIRHFGLFANSRQSPAVWSTHRRRANMR